MIEIDSQTPPALWKIGDGGRPSRPIITRRDERSGGLLLVELDCGHTFLMDEGALADGWGDKVYTCPFGHVIIARPRRPMREVARRVFEAEEKLRRARRLVEGDTGARLLMEMEDVLRADPWACDEPEAEECAAPRDGESDPCWEHRRRKLLDRLGR